MAFAVYLPPGALSRLLAVMMAVALALAAGINASRSNTGTSGSTPACHGAARLLLAAALGLCLGCATHARAEAIAGRGSPGFATGRVRVAACEGILAADPRRTATGMTGYEIEVSTFRSTDGARVTASGRLNVFARLTGKSRPGEPCPEPLRGQRVLVVLRREPLAPRTGGGAWPDALATPTAFVDEGDVRPTGTPPALESARAAVRKSLLGALSGASGRAGPLLEALVAGVRDDLDADLAADFRDAGCAHILALSGQHVGILAAFVSLILGFAIGPFRARALACALAGLYLYVVGPMPSVARAVLMFWVSSAAAAADRPQPPLAVLSITFAVAALLQPTSAHALSFKLSYLAVAGIAVYGPVYEFGLRRWLPPPVSGALATGLAALAATAGLSIIAFGRLNPFSPLSSAVAGLLVAALMWSGIVAAAIAAALPFAAPVTAALVCLPYDALAAFMALAARLPSIEARTGRASLGLVVALGAAIVYALPHVAFIAGSRNAGFHSGSPAGQLRLSQRTLRHARWPWPRHAEEIRTELPHKRQFQAPHLRPLRRGTGNEVMGDRTGSRIDDPRGAGGGTDGLRFRD